jgi:hypothetical protein
MAGVTWVILKWCRHDLHQHTARRPTPRAQARSPEKVHTRADVRIVRRPARGGSGVRGPS